MICWQNTMGYDMDDDLPFTEDEIRRTRISARDAEIINRIIAHRAAPERRRDLAAAYNITVSNLRVIEKRGLRTLKNVRRIALPADTKEIPVRESGLSERAANCLLRTGVKTLGELTEKSRRDLLAITDIGVVVADEIELKLAQYGMFLIPAPPGPDPKEFRALTKAIDRSITGIERVFRLALDMRANDVDAMLLGLEDAKREALSGMTCLKLALDARAKHYGIE